MRILIVKTSSMGDVVHAAPLASDLHAQVPDAVIDWVVEESFAAIPALHPAVAAVIPIALRRWRKTALQPATWREIRAVRERLRAAEYDQVIDCQGLLKSAWVSRWARGSRTAASGPDRNSAREPLAAWFYDKPVAVARTLHAIERNRRIGAAALGYAIQGAPRFGLQAPPLAIPEIAPLFGSAPVAVLLTNASRATKLWPDEHWRKVQHALQARGLATLLFWGSDAEETDTRRRAAQMQGATVAPRCTLHQVAAALSSARAVVGLDTGLTHLAAALGAPTVGIFCDYDPKLVGITGDARCESLGGAQGGPTPDKVMAAIGRVLDEPR